MSRLLSLSLLAPINKRPNTKNNPPIKALTIPNANMTQKIGIAPLIVHAVHELMYKTANKLLKISPNIVKKTLTK